MARIASAFLLFALGSTGGLGQPAGPSQASTQIDSQKVIGDVRRILAANYVLAEVRPKLEATLTQALAAGRYNVSDPNVLVDRVNADLNAVAHDKHLGMHYDPAQSADLAARPPGAGADDAPPTEAETREARRLNHGITELRVLPGNIRYMNLVGFIWTGRRTAEAYDNAIRFLKEGDAAIIDLRQNGGGSPEAVQYLVSHFLKANQPLVTFYMGANKVERFSALPSLPSGRLIGKPLYVLTSGGTASAAEEFTGHVAGFKLGEIVGDNTAGAAFRNEFFPVAGGYVISVSVGRPVLASTGKDWETVGIAPTIKIDSTKALEAAQVHALTTLAASVPGGEKKIYEASAAALDAQINPIATALPLRQYVGVYGIRSITDEGGKLVFQRKGGPKNPLVAVGPNEFAFISDPLERVKFKVTGNIATELELIRADGSRVVAARNP